MPMSKKDYEKFAEAFSAVLGEFDDATKKEKNAVACTIVAAIDVMQADNALFDRAKFIAACTGD